MIKITNGFDEFVVTKGAYATIYKVQGYEVVDEASDENEDAREGKGMSEEEKFMSEIVEKPIGQWSKAELKRYAEIAGIKLEGHTVDQVREAIKNSIG